MFNRQKTEHDIKRQNEFKTIKHKCKRPMLYDFKKMIS